MVSLKGESHKDEEKEITKSPTEALLGNAGSGDPEIIRYFLFLIFYLFILLILSNFFSPLIAFILWIATGFGIYKIAENYGEDVPWIKQILEKVQNIGFTSTSRDTAPEAVEASVDGPEEEKAADLDNYAEKFDEWRVTKDTISPTFVSAGNRIRDFSFNSPGFYKVRLWLFLILVPLFIWIVFWDIATLPFQFWCLMLGFSQTDTYLISSIMGLFLSYFIIIRLYSHCTNNRNLPINSDMMSDFDNYTVKHLFRLPREQGTIGLTLKALLLDFMVGWTLYILAIFYVLEMDSVQSSIGSFIASEHFTLLKALIYFAVCVPIIEELLFRGFVLDLASEAYGFWTAIIISSVLFGLVHLNPYGILNAFFGGLIYGYVRIRTNSLLPSIFLHSIWNAHTVILEFMGFW